MRALPLGLYLSATLILAACGKPQTANNAGPAATTPATALAPPATPSTPTASATQRQEAGLAPSQPDKLAQSNEDGTETAGDTAGDSGAHNPLLAAVASTMAASTAAAAAETPLTAPPLWQEGVNYTRLVPAQPTSVPAGQVEVLEFFWYSCPHCYAIDPQVESWRKTKPAYISFSRVPVMWSESHRSTARLYYTLESMGKLDQLHTEVFKEIHVNGDPLIASDPNDAAGAERVQGVFLKKFGIPDDAFKTTYHSLPVDVSMQRADELGLRYRIEGVPTFVVNGKYIADVRTAGSPERLLMLVGDLAAQEHKH
ncbi:MAG: thiol:disulfide interchange protein DsbA/DsbL [Steroidobacteraceae bacterium]